MFTPPPLLPKMLENKLPDDPSNPPPLLLLLLLLLFDLRLLVLLLLPPGRRDVALKKLACQVSSECGIREDGLKLL